jgi:hypothetical protein
MASIKSEWETYRQEAIPFDAPSIQIQECRRAFYAGVSSLFTILMEDLSDEDSYMKVESVHVELREFISDMLKGNA